MENQNTHSKPNNQYEITIYELFVVLLKRWWIIAVATVVFFTSVYGYYSAKYVPKYTATAKMYVNNNSVNIGAAQVSITNGDLQTAQSLVSVYGEILKTHLVLDIVGADLEKYGYKGYCYEKLIGNISCGSLNNTAVFYVSYVDTNPQRAIDIVNTIVDDLPERISLVIDGSSARTVDKAKVAKPISSNVTKNALYGGMAGLVLSYAFFVLFDLVLNDRFKTGEWLSENFERIPVLGTVPNSSNSKKNKYYNYYNYRNKSSDNKSDRKSKLTSGNLCSEMSFISRESFNTIRTNISLSSFGNQGCRVLGITSPSPNDGKSYTGINLAYSLASSGSRVLLVNSDMRKPSVEKYLKISAKRGSGLSEYLCGIISFEELDVVDDIKGFGFSILTSGSMPPDPSDLLNSEKMTELIEKLKDYYDYIILDLPPVCSVVDAVAAAHCVDGMIVVVRQGASRHKDIRDAVSKLDFAKVKILGFVHNDFIP